MLADVSACKYCVDQVLGLYFDPELVCGAGSNRVGDAKTEIATLNPSPHYTRL